MRYAPYLIAAVMSAACSDGRPGLLPTGLPPDTKQPPHPVATAFVWGMVVDESGVCIDSVTVSIIAGQGVGQSVQQKPPCGAWDYGGGFNFTDLTPGLFITLRVSAPGYAVLDTTVVTRVGTQFPVLITPRKR